MPFTPESIERAIGKNPVPTEQGEEGLLHQRTINDRDVYIKEWRGKHYLRWEDLSSTFSPESDRSPVSPFFAALRFYEQKLIHLALPEVTLPMHAAYDRRQLADDPKLRPFLGDRGRPVTVSPTIPQDTPEAQERAEVLRRFSDAYFPHIDWKNEEKAYNDHGREEEADAAAEEMNRSMRAAYGEDFGYPLHVDEDQTLKNGFSFEERSLIDPILYTFLSDHSIDAFRQRFPKGKILPFLERGLRPNHPEFNYLPQTHADGVFIEVEIVDIERLKKSLLAEQPIEADQIEEYVRQFIALKLLDTSWRRLSLQYRGFFKSYGLNETVILTDPDFNHSIREYFRELRTHLETLLKTPNPDWKPLVIHRLSSEYSSLKTLPEELCSLLKNEEKLAP